MLELKSKAAHRKKFEPLGLLGGGFREAQKPPKNHENTQKLVFLDYPKISLSDPNGSNFFLWAVFDFNSSIFYIEAI